MMKYLLYLMLVLVDQLQHSSAANTEDNLIVEISNGQIRGQNGTTAGLNKPYVAFQGIPFAQPPIGDLRFESPIAPENWTGILNTTEYKGDCVQVMDMFVPGTITGSEDCLYINVFKPDVSEQNLPVMVWIYGGAFYTGTSSTNTYGPDYLLDNDVIVVTFNYRLGIFGFLSTGDLVAPGNSGLKDQLLALKWVNENIADFGGDSNNITIFGESAGASSIAYHLTSNASTGLFNKAILESGSSLCSWSLSKHMPKAVSLVAENLNLTKFLDLVTALKSVNSTTLHLVSDSVRYSLEGPYTKGFVFAPVTEPLHSGAFITGKSHQLLTEGQFSQVPVLQGINSMESLYFYQIVEAYYQNSSIERADIVPIGLNLVNETDIELVYNKINDFYFGSEKIYNQTYQTYQFFSHNEFSRAAVETNRLLSNYTKTYFYEFSYSGNLTLFPEYAIPGIPHTAELYYIWNPKIVVSPTNTDILVRNRMTKLWTNFAKFGNPTPEQDNLFDNVTWHPSNYVKDNLLYFNISSELDLAYNPMNQYIEFWNNLYNEYGNPPFETY